MVNPVEVMSLVAVNVIPPVLVFVTSALMLISLPASRVRAKPLFQEMAASTVMSLVAASVRLVEPSRPSTAPSVMMLLAPGKSPAALSRSVTSVRSFVAPERAPSMSGPEAWMVMLVGSSRSVPLAPNGASRSTLPRKSR